MDLDLQQYTQAEFIYVQVYRCVIYLILNV